MYKKIIEAADDLFYSMKFLEVESKKESKKADRLFLEVIFWSALMFLFDSHLLVSAILFFFLLNSVYKYYLSGRRFLNLIKDWETAITKLSFILKIDL